MPESSTLTLGLAFLTPLGYALIAAGGLPSDKARHAAVNVFAALGLAVVGYVLCGFALQFGGVGLAYDRPGFDRLIWEWSALGPTWGPGWGMAGLAGWALSGAAATAAARQLALGNLPWVMTAATIPLVALGSRTRRRAPAWAAGLLGLLAGAIFYPLAGNWIWGGGWLANLADNLGLGHGFVDPAGAGLVHLLGAAIALAGLLVFLPQREPAHPAYEPTPLPVLYLPLLCLLGAGLLLIGAVAWLTANPLLPSAAVESARFLLNLSVAAAVGGLVPLVYTWLVAGRPDALMAARGFATSVVVSMGAAPFISSWGALVLGASVGLLIPIAVFGCDRVLHLDDATATLTVHGLGGALGIAAVGLLADGTAGAGWNGIGVSEYLGAARQGVTGLLAAGAFRADWPGQMQAQLAGIAALALFGFFGAWLAIAPLATLLHYLAPHPVPVSSRPEQPVDAGEPVRATPAEAVDGSAAMLSDVGPAGSS